MPLKTFRHRETGELKESLKTLDLEVWEAVLESPNFAFMETIDPINKKARMKNQHKILKARARNHSRDVDADDTIGINLANGLGAQVKRNLLNENGQRRRKIDDL